MAHVETGRQPSLGFFPGCQSQLDRFLNSIAWFELVLEKKHKKEERVNILNRKSPEREDSVMQKTQKCAHKEGKVTKHIKE